MKRNYYMLKISGWLLVLLLAAGCKRNKGELPSGSAVEVHVLGEEDGAAGTDNVQWINGDKKIFQAGFRPVCIRNFGNDIYVLGWLYDVTDEKNKIAYFKNDILHKMETTASTGGVSYQPEDIFISGNDIYIAGVKHTGSAAINGYFKNAQWNELKIPPGYNSLYIRAVAVADGNVHIAGTGFPSGGSNARPVYWKNTTGVSILSALPGYAAASDIKVVAGKVYISGRNGGDKACYWTDGVRTDLPLAANMETSGAEAILVQGADVLIAGWQQDADRDEIACYWKNGQSPVIMSVPAGSSVLNVTGMAADGTDVYLSGEYYTGSSNEKACYWKNGTFYKLSDAESETQGIVVIKK
ncbi:MAG TPA: hypothetical protein PKC69_13530 [Chitinophagaceae bacterium]|nr:hypothetical protein [Chitinophagaceae bacterium]